MWKYWPPGQEGPSEITPVSASVLQLRKRRPQRGGATRSAKGRAGVKPWGQADVERGTADRGWQARPRSWPTPSHVLPAAKKWPSLYALAGDRQAGGVSLSSALWTRKARRRNCASVPHRWTLDGGLFVFSQHIASCMLLCPVLHGSPICRTGPGTQQVFKK